MGSIHVVVVDPGVGSARRPILVEAGGHCFVAPDNGVLSMSFERAREYSVRHITADRYFRHPVSQTFHGRDIFGPVAGHLAAGTPASRFGKTIPDAVALELSRPVMTGDGSWTGTILHVDRFGNLITNFAWEDFSWVADRPFELLAAGHIVRSWFPTYAGAGSDPFVTKGSSGFLEVSLSQGDCGKFLGISPNYSIQLQEYGIK